MITANKIGELGNTLAKMVPGASFENNELAVYGSWFMDTFIAKDGEMSLTSEQLFKPSLERLAAKLKEHKNWFVCSGSVSEFLDGSISWSYFDNAIPLQVNMRYHAKTAGYLWIISFYGLSYEGY